MFLTSALDVGRNVLSFSLLPSAVLGADHLLEDKHNLFVLYIRYTGRSPRPAASPICIFLRILRDFNPIIMNIVTPRAFIYNIISSQHPLLPVLLVHRYYYNSNDTTHAHTRTNSYGCWSWTRSCVTSSYTANQKLPSSTPLLPPNVLLQYIIPNILYSQDQRSFAVFFS